MSEVKISTRGRLTIPKKIRDKLCLEEHRIRMKEVDGIILIEILKPEEFLKKK